jgi:hypothetical protein
MRAAWRPRERLAIFGRFLEMYGAFAAIIFAYQAHPYYQKGVGA